MPCKDKELAMKTQLNRRDFLKRSLAGAASASPLMAMLGSLSDLQAAEVDGEYKAIVCVLLEGGADAFNMVTPRDDAYNAYAKVRKHLALPKDSLLSITDQYGMRENMGKMQALFNDKHLAIIANVGTLIEPTALKGIQEGTAKLPPQLFAHNTQRDLWMLGSAKETLKNGWAARTGDAFYPTPNPYFNISIAGNNLMQTGGITEAMAFDDASISSDTMASYGFGPESGGGELGAVYRSLYKQHARSTHSLMRAMASKRFDELRQQEILGETLFENVRSFDGLFGSGIHETGKPLGKQLEIVAKILSVHQNFPGGRKRQIFFVNHHGWDTHDSDNEHQVGYLSDQLGAFYDALKEMGIQNNVTTFTLSDFGRSLSPNGTGTDHGWGSHAFVMGGAVKGGEIYGTMPRLEPDSPDAWIDRMIPTTSMESYLSTIVKWFGATENELNVIFPNRRAFSPLDLGFMR
jgi:uncharacterized protein (DUF1501 family)